MPSDVTTPDSSNYGNGKFQCGKFGGLIVLRGGVNVKPASSAKLIGTLPEGYRPSTGTVTKLAACDGNRKARISVHTDGGVYLDWVYSVSGSKYTSGSIWIDCNMIFAM